MCTLSCPGVDSLELYSDEEMVALQSPVGGWGQEEGGGGTSLYCISQIAALYFTSYHGLAIYAEVTFLNVHHEQMSTFVIQVCLWYIGFVLVFISSFHYIKKYRLWCNVSVQYPKPA